MIAWSFIGELIQRVYKPMQAAVFTDRSVFAYSVYSVYVAIVVKMAWSHNPKDAIAVAVQYLVVMQGYLTDGKLMQLWCLWQEACTASFFNLQLFRACVEATFKQDEVDWDEISDDYDTDDDLFSNQPHAT